MLSIYQVFELGGTSFWITLFSPGINNTASWFVVVFCFVFLPVHPGMISCFLRYV